LERVKSISRLDKKNIAQFYLLSIQPEHVNTGLSLVKSLIPLVNRDVVLSLVSRGSVTSYTQPKETWDFTRNQLLDLNPDISPRSEYVCFYRYLVLLSVSDLVLSGNKSLAAELAFEYLQTPATIRTGFFAESQGISYLLDRFILVLMN
jgi:hypothetical protein